MRVKERAARQATAPANIRDHAVKKSVYHPGFDIEASSAHAPIQHPIPPRLLPPRTVMLSRQ
jgi:hypothetical protein